MKISKFFLASVFMLFATNVDAYYSHRSYRSSDGAWVHGPNGNGVIQPRIAGMDQSVTHIITAARALAIMA